MNRISFSERLDPILVLGFEDLHIYTKSTKDKDEHEKEVEELVYILFPQFKDGFKWSFTYSNYPPLCSQASSNVH